MPVTYRSLSRFESGKVDIEHLVMEQFRKWLHDDPKIEPRRFNADMIEDNAVTAFSPHSEVVLVNKVEKDNSKAIRARMTENKINRVTGQEERWISTLTLFLPSKRDQRGFFLFEVDSPFEKDKNGFTKPIRAGRPGFLYRVLELEEVPLFDGQYARLTTEPRLIDVDECEILMLMACDPTRRGALILMGTSSNEPTAIAMERAKRVFSKLPGTATSFVLTPTATQEFNERIGSAHSVFPQSIRTYHPEVVPNSAYDARRHPFVGAERFNQLGEPAVMRMLENATRRLTLESVLPHFVQRVEERMTAEQNQIVINGRRVVAYSVQQPTSIPTNLEKEMETIERDVLADQVSEYLEIQARFRQVLDFENLTLGVADEIADKLSRFDIISNILTQTSEENLDLKRQITVLRDDMNEQKFDHLETFEEKDKYQNQLEYMKIELANLGQAELDVKECRKKVNELAHTNLSWIEQSDEHKIFSPKDFFELIYSMDKLPFLEFTGEEEGIEEIDRDEMGAYSGRTWEGLRTLNDYVRAKKDGATSAGLYQYLSNSPAGYYNNWPDQKYAANESDSVVSDERLRALRMFTVPKSVDPSGRALMIAHLKVGYRLRVHFLDDVAKTGKIYIGYIGRHLTTVSTN